MNNYVEIVVPEDLLVQVVGELLEFAGNANLVEVVHAEKGRVIHAHQEIAEAWFQARQQEDAVEKIPAPPTPAPPKEPVKPAPTPAATASVPPKEPVKPAPVPAPAPLREGSGGTAARAPVVPPKKTTSA